MRKSIGCSWGSRQIQSALRYLEDEEGLAEVAGRDNLPKTRNEMQPEAAQRKARKAESAQASGSNSGKKQQQASQREWKVVPRS
jgi:hypothetical protein